MRRSGLWFGLPILLVAVLLVGCDSSTDLTEVTVAGQWDGIGAMQATFAGTRLDLTQSSDGTVSGSWRRGNLTGGVTGVNQAGNLEITLVNFEVGTVTFEGRFIHSLQMEGSLNGSSLDGAAIFRRVHY